MQSAVSKVAGLTDADKWVLTVVLPNSGIFTTVFPLVSGNLFEIWTAITEQLYRDRRQDVAPEMEGK